MPSFAFLVSHDPRHGLGHWRRMAVLARALKAVGAEVLMVAGEGEVPADVGSIYDAVCGLGDAAAATMVVVDGKDYSEGILSALKPYSDRLVLIDDVGRPVLPAAGVLINPNLYGASVDYDASRFPVVLAGPEWNLIDPRFAALADNGDRHGTTVCFGGADDGRWAAPVLAALKGAVTWVDAGQRVLIPEVRNVLGARPDVHHVTAPDMAAVYAATDILICGAGQMSVEGLLAGCRVIAVQVADDQALQIAALAEMGVTTFTRLDLESIVAAISSLRKPSIPMLSGGPARVAAQLMAMAKGRSA